MKKSSGLGNFITVQVGSVLVASYHLTFSLNSGLLENIFPMGKKTGIFKVYGDHLKTARKMSFCVLAARERTSC